MAKAQIEAETAPICPFETTYGPEGRGSNPHGAKKTRNRKVSGLFVCISCCFLPLLFLTQTLTPTGADSGKVYTARERMLPMVCAALSCASVVTWA